MEVLIVLVVTLAVIFMLCILKIKFFDQKVKSEKRTAKKTEIQSLGELPYNEQNGNLMIENNPKANIMKYIKDIRDNLVASNQKVISIISCNNGEGKSYVANNLAVSMARLNKNVLLIDANLREESNKSDIFYIEKGEGLTDYIKEIEIDNNLENLNNAKKYIKQTQIPHLYVLQNGTLSENCYELLKTQNFRELIKLLRDVYDLILIDGTSFMENEDALVISKISDLNVLVTENNVTEYKDILEIKQVLEYNNDSIYGFVLNKTDYRKGKYYSNKQSSKFGMFIENIEELNNPINLDEIIDPITQKLYAKENQKFEVLHKEIKDNIMNEDFINDVEFNFDMKIDKIEKQNEKNLNNLLESIQTLRQDVNKEKENNEVRRTKESRSFERFTEIITEKFVKMEEQISQIKKKNEIEKECFEQRINEQELSQIEQIENLEMMLNNKLIQQSQAIEENIKNQGLIFYEELAKNRQELNSKIENQNTIIYEKMEDQEKESKKTHESLKILFHKELLEQQESYVERLKTLSDVNNKQNQELETSLGELIKSQNEIHSLQLKDHEDRLNELINAQSQLYSEKLNQQAELHNEQIESQAQIYNEKLAKQEEKYDEQMKLQAQEYNETIAQLEEKQSKQIEEQIQLYNEKIVQQEERNNEQMKAQAKIYNNKIAELRLQIDNLIEIQKTQIQKDALVKNNNENKIINLGKFFNNRRKNNNDEKNIFSIYEPISYEDLERLAIEVILLNDDDTSYFNDMAK